MTLRLACALAVALGFASAQDRVHGDPWVLADVNGDGRADLIQARGALSKTGRIQIDLQFSRRLFPRVALAETLSLRAVDVDRDSDIDLVLRDTRNQVLGWWANDGSGNFAEGDPSATPDIPKYSLAGTAAHQSLALTVRSRGNARHAVSRPVMVAGELPAPGASRRAAPLHATYSDRSFKRPLSGRAPPSYS